MASIDASKTINLKTSSLNIAIEKNARQNYHYLQLAILLGISFWLLNSVVHYFWYGELVFKVIPTDSEDLWMRSTVFIMLASFGLFADITSRKFIEKSNRKNQAEIIARAKKQWELAVDSLPQLVIAMDDNARITRVNRTIEKWGVGKVNKVVGLNVSDFLKSLNKNFTDNDWDSDWIDIWQQIKNKDHISKKIENRNISKTYLYTLRKIPEYDAKKDRVYATLVIDDITTRQDLEKSLKTHALNLEEKVKERTSELDRVNNQLKHELDMQKIAKDKLHKSQECRLDLLRDLFTAQETERKRIAHELHDSIGQSLGAAKFKLEELLIDKQNFPDGDKYDEFNTLVNTIKNAINEVRHIAMDLRPAMLDDLGVLATLNWFSREFQNTYKKMKVNLSLGVDESDISDDKRVVIFRIVQEAMNNVVKHSNATKIDIELTKSRADMKLCIRDNGCGFNYKNPLNNINISQLPEANQPRCSFGLSSMRERAESTNGEFEIESSPDKGTAIKVTWKNHDTTA
jgi:signal transduction histidine kinase